MGAQRGQSRPKRTKKVATPASAWKKPIKSVPLDVPSGNTCLVERRTLEAFIKQGKVPNVLVAIIQEQIEKNEEFDPTKYNWDSEQLSAVFDMIDYVIVECVVEPNVQAVPDPDEDQVRDPDVLYVDEVDFDDKAFIFQFVIGGTADLAKFRKELASSVSSS